MTEIEAGHFANHQVVAGADVHRADEIRRMMQLKEHLAAAHPHAPDGTWLDIGCGTGSLLALARDEFGIKGEGVELSADRRAMAKKVTGMNIYSDPLESLKLPAESFAAVTLVNVFSHLTSPRATLAEIRRVLVPGGVVLLVTGEIGLGVRKDTCSPGSGGSPLFSRTAHDRAVLLGSWFRADIQAGCLATVVDVHARSVQDAGPVKAAQCRKAVLSLYAGSSPSDPVVHVED
jgi:SAM-dependent methyltransferase